MAKSNTPRTLIDEITGKKYQFDKEAFKKTLHSHVDKKNHIHQITILRQIEETYNIPVERMQNWLKGVNGPGDMKDIKDIADFFNIDFYELLIDQNPTKKDEPMINNEEKSIIKQIFGECVSILYKVQEMTNLPKPQNQDRIEYKKKNLFEMDALIRKIHILVDQNSLILDKYNKYNLHRILLELNEFMYGVLEYDHSSIPERWDEISNIFTIEEAIVFPYFQDRTTYLENPSSDDAYLYLSDEISLADEMGLIPCLTPTDKEWEILEQTDTWTNFGYIPNNERYSLNPSIIWIDLMIEVLTEIFETDFPNIFSKR